MLSSPSTKNNARLGSRDRKRLPNCEWTTSTCESPKSSEGVAGGINRFIYVYEMTSSSFRYQHSAEILSPYFHSLYMPHALPQAIPPCPEGRTPIPRRELSQIPRAYQKAFSHSLRLSNTDTSMDRSRGCGGGGEFQISWKALRFIIALVQCWIWSRAVHVRVVPVESLGLSLGLYWGELVEEVPEDCSSFLEGGDTLKITTQFIRPCFHSD